ncbi:Leucine-rich_repeat domain superfamily [Hexamita inflata]|uniref:Leucine-rich repeat domain superfamily n=1 Tax=Hexamita inflata TaxID=28002 RepID=A0AA86UBX4_9EUKA|nr:Leucine-rich repeat domain superfamily [Hexamita inflata]
MKSCLKKLFYEQKNSCDPNQLKATTLDNLSEYDKSMIEIYQRKIKDGTLTIKCDPDLESLNFINTLKISQLQLYDYKYIVPQLANLTIKELKIIDCKIYSVKGFQLENLEVLEVRNNVRKLESKGLAQEILQFKRLKELSLQKFITNISLSILDSLNQAQYIVNFVVLKPQDHSLTYKNQISVKMKQLTSQQFSTQLIQLDYCYKLRCSQTTEKAERIKHIQQQNCFSSTTDRTEIVIKTKCKFQQNHR